MIRSLKIVKEELKLIQHKYILEKCTEKEFLDRTKYLMACHDFLKHSKTKTKSTK